MLPTLQVVVGTTRVVVSLHALAIVVGVAAGALLVARRMPGPAPGLATAALVAVAAPVGCLRGALESLRDPGTTDVLPGGIVTFAQAAALVLVLVGLVGERVLRGREPSIMPPRRRS